MTKPLTPTRRVQLFVQTLFMMSAFAVALSVCRIIATQSDQYWFLLWNLFLAWLPLLFAWILYRRSPKGLEWSVTNFMLFLLWLLFLPNAFYLISDFVHLSTTGDISIMYDVVLLSTYAVTGMILGYTSLFLIHMRSYQRFGKKAHLMVVISLLLCGFAIYLGRYLRWNSWDILVNPFGLLFDVTDNFINPGDHILTFSTTILFFAFLASIYLVIWRAIAVVATTPKSQ